MPRRVRGPGLRAGLGPRASTAGACLFASCRLQKPEELIKNRWAGRGSSGCRPGPSPSSSQPSLQLQAASSPGPLRCNRCRCRLPHGIRLLQSMPPAPPALPMPLSGAGVAPVPGPGLQADGRNLGCFPPKSHPLICFKGPAPHSRCLMARLGWGGLPKFSMNEWLIHTATRSGPIAQQGDFCGPRWGGSGLCLLPS